MTRPSHAAPSRTGVATATTTVSATLSPATTAPGSAHAAPTGVRASTRTASVSCTGTLPCHSSEARKTTTGTTTTRIPTTSTLDSSRERRSRRNIDVSAIATRASITHVAMISTTERMPAQTGAPRDSHTVAVVVASASTANTGTDTAPSTASTPARRRGDSPSTPNRRGSSGSGEPVTTGARAKPSVIAAPPMTATAANASGVASSIVVRAQHAATTAAVSTSRPAVMRTMCRGSPRRAPSIIASLSRRRCAATRGLPRR